MTKRFNVHSRSKHVEVNFTGKSVFKLEHSAEMLWQCQTVDKVLPELDTVRLQLFMC
jgi:hypothetical protein